MVTWNRFFAPASSSQIERFERNSGVSLPPSYKSFLLSTNGGQPCSDVCFVIPELGEEVMLGALFGISDQEDGGLSLEYVYADAKDDIPADYVPIGEDPGGNRLLLATSGAQREAIFFWDRVGFLAKRTGKSMFQLAASIDDFLKALPVF